MPQTDRVPRTKKLASQLTLLWWQTPPLLMSQSRYLEFTHPITEHVFMLVGTNVERTRYVSMGTGFAIAEGIAMTARHVFEELWKEFDCSGKAYGSAEIMETKNSEVFAIHFSGLERMPRLWRVTASVDAPATDISIMYLAPIAPMHDYGLWPKNFGLDFAPPVIGEELFAFGYPTINVREQAGEDVTFEGAPQFVAGFVTEVYPERRDSVMLPSPSFQVDVEFGHAMSGGPIFKKSTGHCCGVISVGGSYGDGLNAGYGVMVWPVLTTRLPPPRASHWPNAPRFLDLCLRGTVANLNLDLVREKQIHIVLDQDGRRRPRISLHRKTDDDPTP